MLDNGNRSLIIKDIAKLCNVSIQTVSRVLNNRYGVAPKTRSRIEQVIAETGYKPSVLARSLVNRRISGLNKRMDNEVSLLIAPNSKLVMVGDSITACQRDVSNSDDLGKGYVSFVHGLLTACYPARQIQVLNRGVPGDTVRELQARWQTDVVDESPDWLSVCIGINDVWQQFDGRHEGQAHVTLAEYEQTLDVLLTSMRPVRKGMILLTPYFIQPHGEPMRAMMDEYGAVVQWLAQRHHAIFLDTQSVFDRAVEFTPIETITWDRAHLNTPGHMILARAVLQAVEFKWSET